jgi:hypothetical protein
MPRYQLTLFSDAVPGEEDRFNDWYDNQHLHDVLKVPGMISAQRFRLATGGSADRPAHGYLAVYEIEADNIAAVQAELRARAGTDGCRAATRRTARASFHIKSRLLWRASRSPLAVASSRDSAITCKDMVHQRRTLWGQK